MGIVAAIVIFLGLTATIYGSTVCKMSFPAKMNVWGVAIQQDPTMKKLRKVWIFGLIVFILGFVLWIAAMVTADFDEFVVTLVCPAIAMFLPIPFGLIFGEKKALKTIKNSKDCLVLGDFEPMKKIDENFNKIKTIEVFADGITLADSSNYVFEQIAFRDCKLGNLENAKQAIAVSCFLLQKYPGVFKRKYNEQRTATVMTGRSMADTATSVTNIVSSAQGQNIVSIRLIKKA